MNLPKKERAKHFSALRNKGDYEANIQSLKENGKFLTVVRNGKDVDVNNFTPCIHCGGIYKKETPVRHLSHCALKKGKGRSSKSNATDEKAGKVLL